MLGNLVMQLGLRDSKSLEYSLFIFIEQVKTWSLVQILRVDTNVFSAILIQTIQNSQGEKSSTHWDSP